MRLPEVTWPLVAHDLPEHRPMLPHAGKDRGHAQSTGALEVGERVRDVVMDTCCSSDSNHS